MHLTFCALVRYSVFMEIKDHGQSNIDVFLIVFGQKWSLMTKEKKADLALMLTQSLFLG